MARKDDAVNEDEENEKPKPKKKSGLIKILAIVFSAILLVASSVGATLLLTGALSHSDDEAAVAAADDEEDAGEADTSKSKAKSKKSKDKKGAKDPKAPPVYVELGEPFVVNFIEAAQIRYLQVKIEAMTRDQAVSEAIKAHLPQIRNNLVLMFSSMDYTSLSTAEGKQKIRDQALVEIQNILKEETGNSGAEAVYFTSFVMQ
jgi:flagellar FliL protein